MKNNKGIVFLLILLAVFAFILPKNALAAPAITDEKDSDKAMLEVFSPDGYIDMMPVSEDSFIETTSSWAAPVFETVKLVDNGPDDKNIVITIMGDGFTASQQDQFIQAAQSVSQYLINFYPYSSFKNKFNIYAVKVISNVSGAAQRPNALIDNYFGSSFYFDNVTQRLLYVTYSTKVRDILNTYTPKCNMPVVLVNSTVYGGGGGTYAVSSLESSAREILVHELGHSFGGLWDEYWYTGSEKPNMTQNSNPATNKWRHWLGYESVGIYAHAESPTWFRPHQNCEMRYLNRQFCMVCATELTKRMCQIDGEPFYGNSTITNVVIPESTHRIVDFAFYGCERLETVTIPEGVESVGRYAFLHCDNLESVTNLSTTPPTINTTTFAGIDRSNVYLHVPFGTKDAYVAAGWTGFKETAEPFIPVSDIIGVPSEAILGTPLTLTGVVLPKNATNQAIIWSIKNAGATGATLIGDTLTALAGGTVVVTAAVKNGLEGPNAANIAANIIHMQAIRISGSLWAWGRNYEGLLSNTATSTSWASMEDILPALAAGNTDFTKDFTITIPAAPVMLEHIGISALPTKTSYFTGEALDLSGLKVNAYYSDGTVKNLEGGYTTSPAQYYTFNAVGSATITISYTDKGVTKDTYFTVQVTQSVLNAIIIDSPPNKIVYTVGETLDLTGIAIKAIYSNGQATAITNYITDPVQGAVLLVAGQLNVKISYSESGIKVENSFVVTVNLLKYTVTFVDWNGRIIDTQAIEPGRSAMAPANPVRQGYIFTGWNVPFNNITANLIVTALYDKTITIETLIANLEELLNTGYAQGKFSNNGSYSSLSSTFSNAKKQFDMGKKDNSIKQFESMITSINKDSGSKIDATYAKTLISSINLILENL
ncbi:MAG: M64 family metallo-endopeptidase [Firmicutes bacterium]|nr:M64 family metallo-endopeptidase [Bacillota bacterium]